MLPSRRPTSALSWILPVLRFLSSTLSSKFVSTMSMRSSSSSSTSTCSPLSRRNMLRKVWTGPTATLVWTCSLALTCLRSPCACWPSLRRSLSSPRPLMILSDRSCLTTCSARSPTSASPTPRWVTPMLTLVLFIMQQLYLTT